MVMGTMVEQPALFAGKSRPNSAVMASTTGDTGVSYDKVINLFTHRHSSELYDRHVAAIHRMCRSAADGFAIRELPKIEQILKFTLELLRSSEHKEVEEATIQLLRTLSLPFVRRTSTDEFKMLSNISSILSTVGTALGSGLPSLVRIAAADMLAAFASAHGNRPSELDLGQASEEADMGSLQRQYHTNQSLIQRSAVVPMVVEALDDAMCKFSVMHVAHGGARRAVQRNGGPGFLPNTGVEYVYKDVGMAMARALVEFTYTKDNAAEAVRAGLMISMPGLLAFDVHDAAVFSGLELLWNCVEFGAPGSRCGPVGRDTIEGVAVALHRLLVQFIDKGFRESDKHTRNEVLLMMVLLMDEPGFRATLCAAGTVSLLAAVSTVPDVADASPYVKPFLLTVEPPDFELRQLSWSCLAALCDDQGALRTAIESGFLRVLLLWADVAALGKASGDKDPAIGRWMPAQQYSLQECALEQLRRLVALAPAAFLDANADRAILEYANNENDPVLLEAALLVLKRGLAYDSLRDALGEAGVIGTALNLLCDLEVNWPETVRSLSAMILGDVCNKSDKNQAIFRQSNGVVLLQQKLTELRGVDPTLPSKLTLVTLRAVWNCIVQNRKNMVRFLVSDGLDALMDLLEIGHSSIHPVSLSIIADVLDNPKAHVFFHEWVSSRTGRRAAQIIMGIWRTEDAKRGMTTKGQLTNTKRPTAGTGKRTEWVPTGEVAYGFQSRERRKETESISAAIDGEQMLKKIYSCFKLLGFPVVAKQLDEDDRATLAGIEAYVKFKQGEFWQDLEAELAAAGVEPVEEDTIRIASGIESAEFLAEVVRTNQRLILRERIEKETEAENAFYESKKTQAMQEQEAKTFKKDRTKLTMAERKAAKNAKEEMLRASHRRNE